MTQTMPLARWLLSTSVLAGILFLCTGRAYSLMLDAYLVVFAGTALARTLATYSSRDGGRRKPRPEELDPASRVAASLLFLVTVSIAALDAGRLHWARAIGAASQLAALIVLLLAAGLQIWAMAVNPFFSTAIRIQTERGHEVITHGPYRHIRHPGYLAMIISMPTTALALGSVVALIPAVCYSLLILRRVLKEDELLRKYLPDYSEYAGAARYRLIPGLW